MAYYYLYPNCKIVKGANQSLIIDLQKRELYSIENFYFNFLNKQLISSLLINQYTGYDKEKILELVQFLIKHGLMYESKFKVPFKEIDDSWIYPHEISNAIIDFKDVTQFELAIECFNKINCECLQIRIFHNITIETLKQIVELSNNYNTINSIEFTFSYFHPFFNDIVLSSKKVSTVYVFNWQFEKITSIDGTYFIYTKNEVYSDKSCGNISVNNFNIHLKNYTESVHYNSCLNCKISIDLKGNIRNCPSMPEEFGNIYTTPLQDVLANKNFKKYWRTTKDKIEVCKDCEFRYICTDCRAYTERTHTNDAGLDVSKPLKCGYNPYTGEWEEWSTNPLKQKAIKFYGME